MEPMPVHNSNRPKVWSESAKWSRTVGMRDSQLEKPKPHTKNSAATEVWDLAKDLGLARGRRADSFERGFKGNGMLAILTLCHRFQGEAYIRRFQSDESGFLR
jgi:hypothetical protein